MANGVIPDVSVVRDDSVQVQPRYEQSPGSSLVLSIASVADDISPWGRYPQIRDRQLREFWPTEPKLASAIYSTAIRNAAFSYTLEGPPDLVEPYQEMLAAADLGGGWGQFCVKWLTDYYTQDNGAFIELIRRKNDDPADPVIGIAHLDAGRCRRTGVPDWPVIYTDRFGVLHRLRPWQVIARAEYPSPVETMNGIGFCAVSRILRAAQFARDVSIYKREKVAGRNPAAIHLINGVKAQEITDAMAAHRLNQDEKGLIRYMLPLILASIDPTATISHEEISLAGLPDGFDSEKEFQEYIANLALALGTDYQDLAPLPGRALGTGAQSLILHLKSRGKGPAFFIKTMEHLFNFHGVLPRNVTFRYDEQDAEEDASNADLEYKRAETREKYVAAGILTPQAVQQQMLDDGEISQELFDAIQQQQAEAQEEERRRFDLTTDVVAEDSEQLGNGPGRRNQAAGVDKSVAAAVKKDLTTPSDFAEAERRTWEAEMADAMDDALSITLSEVQETILGRKASRLWQKDDESARNLPDNAGFWERFRQRMMGAILPFVRRVGLGAAEYNATLGLGVDMDLVNEAVLEYSRSYVSEWWGEISESTQRSMRAAIVAWQETGLGTEGLSDLVDALEPLFGRARASRIASTEVTRIFDEGNRLAHQSAGIEMEEWQTVRDELVCPTCSPLDGERFAVNDGPRPPQHVNCRCARLPVANNRSIGGRA